MLSLFPELLFLSPFAAFLIRIAVGILLAVASYKHFATTGAPLSIRTLACLQAIAAILLILGAYTQVAALFGLIMAIVSLSTARYRIFPRSTLALGAIMAFTLLLTGAGPFAFDLPL